MSTDNSKYADRAGDDANGSPSQFALRELQRLCTSPQFWFGLIAVTAILTAAGPFGTLQSLSMAERIAYWGLTAILTFLIGVGGSTYISRLFEVQGIASWFVRVASGLIVAVPVTAMVSAINWLLLGHQVGTRQEIATLFAYCAVISVAVTVLYYLITSHRDNADKSTARQNAPILKRLPRHLGKELLHLSAQDHYVEAATDRGSHLILMRFGDALEEASSIDGIRIHRAHWIALEGVRKPVNKDGRLFIEMIDGNRFPVSRTYLKQVRERLNL